jgi:hypothetical protein
MIRRKASGGVPVSKAASIAAAVLISFVMVGCARSNDGTSAAASPSQQPAKPNVDWVEGWRYAASTPGVADVPTVDNPAPNEKNCYREAGRLYANQGNQQQWDWVQGCLTESGQIAQFNQGGPGSGFQDSQGNDISPEQAGVIIRTWTSPDG